MLIRKIPSFAFLSKSFCSGALCLPSERFHLQTSRLKSSAHDSNDSVNQGVSKHSFNPTQRLHLKDSAEMSYLSGPVHLQYYSKLIRNESDERVVERVLFTHELLKLEKAKVPSRISLHSMSVILSDLVYYDQQGQAQFKDLHLKSYLEKQMHRAQFKSELKRQRSFVKGEPMRRLSAQIKRNPDQAPIDLLDVGIRFDADGRPEYGKWKVTMSLPCSKSDLKRFRPHRLLQSALDGPHLAIDFSCFHLMSRQEKLVAGVILKKLYTKNFVQPEPFNLCLTSFAEHIYNELLCWHLPKMYAAKNCLQIESNHFVQCLPQTGPSRKVIYLVENATDELVDYDPTALYVLPFFFDQTRTYNRIDLNRLNRSGVECRRIAVEKHVLLQEFEYTPDFSEAHAVLMHLKSGLNLSNAIQLSLDLNKVKTNDQAMQHERREVARVVSYKSKTRVDQRKGGLFFDDDDDGDN